MFGAARFVRGLVVEWCCVNVVNMEQGNRLYLERDAEGGIM